MIKKIEHFWKGLSHDRSQISALPPEQYGDRFYNFVEGITLSAEAARREALRKEREVMEGMTSTEKSTKRNSAHKHSHGVPPMPDHLPPPPPVGGSSSQAQETMEKASKEARRTESKGALESEVPDRILSTSSSSPDKRESFQHEPILPIVEEAAETRGNEEGSRWTKPANSRKGATAIPPAPTGPPPPTPPKHRPPPLPLKSDGFDGQMLKPRLSKESLNKDLPPLPRDEETQDSGVRMI
jgi:1-phosphatidylinositol-4-phosphate 5-kinase